jgi:hypothetical protein
MNRTRNVPQSALMVAFEQGRAAGRLEFDAEQVWDHGWVEGYHVAVEEWECFIESLPQDLYDALRDHIIFLAAQQNDLPDPPF